MPPAAPNHNEPKLLVAEANKKLWRGGDAVLKYLYNMNPRVSQLTKIQVIGFFDKFTAFARDLISVSSESQFSTHLARRTNVFQCRLQSVRESVDARNASITGMRFKNALFVFIEYHKQELLQLDEHELVRRIGLASRGPPTSTILLSVVNNHTKRARFWWALKSSPYPLSRVLANRKSLLKLWDDHNEIVRLCAVALTHRSDLNYPTLPDRVVSRLSTPSWFRSSPSRTR